MEDNFSPSDTDSLKAEITRLNKIIQVLITRAENSPPPKNSEFYLFQRTIMLEDQVRQRTAELEEALQENKKAFLLAETNEKRILVAQYASKVGIFDRDVEADTIHFDEKSREIFGLEVENMISLDEFITLLHPEDREPTRAAILQSQDPLGDGEYHAEYRIFNRITGDERHIEANAQAVFEDDRVVRFIGAVKDVTEKKIQTNTRKARRIEMEELLTQQVAAQTAAAIAHELNQPLVAISAYSEVALRILQNNKIVAHELERVLEASRSQAQRAGGKLHELMSFLRTGETITAVHDLGQIVREAISIIEADNPSRIQLELLTEENIPSVVCNRIQVQKVLVNLLFNSLDAAKEANMARVCVRVSCRTGEVETLAQISVKDNGPGIHPSVAPRIFDPFFTTKSNGTGLGLAMCKSLIESNGGRIWLNPQEDSGATVNFTLPFQTSSDVE